MKKFYGTGVALITPFTKNLEVDYKGLKNLMNFTAKGVDYYVVMGTTAEAPTISKEEKLSILQFVKDNNKKKLPIVYGIGGNNTEEVVKTIKETDLSGVDALLSVSPYYNKPTQEGIYQHFKKIADKSPVPIILYNIPGRTASNMTAETTLRLAQHKNIIGIKEASGNIEQCLHIVKNAPSDFLMIAGDDILASSFYAFGGKGTISVLASAYPLIFKKMKEHSLAGKTAKAMEAQFKLLEINGSMYEEGNPIGIKYLLSKMGICEEHVRLPHVSASVGLRKKIDALSKNMK